MEETNEAILTGIFRDELVKNVLMNYASSKHFKIACYRAPITAARTSADRDTPLVCDEILLDEQEMADWLLDRLPNQVARTLEGDPGRRAARR